MTHLENHPHAFINENNIVVGVYLFDDHNDSLIDQVKESLNAFQVIPCCEYGLTSKDSELYNGKFYLPQPYPEWIRDEEIGEWIAPEDWVDPDIIVE